MNASTQMLNWFWWNHRISILFCFFSVVIAQLAYWVGAAINSEEALGVSYLLLVVSMCGTFAVAFSMFTFGRDLNLTSGKSSFPQWLYGLPVRSTQLALVPVIAMLFALAWAWCPFSLAMLNQQYVSNRLPPSAPILTNCYFGIFLPWVAMCAFATWMQAIAWWPYRSAIHRGIALFAVAFLVALLISLGYDAPVWFPQAAIYGTAISGTIAAPMSVSLARQRTWLADQESGGSLVGGLGSLAGLKSKESRPSFEISNTTRFSNKETALGWRDWGQLGRIPFLLMAVVVVSSLAGVLLAERTATGIVLFIAPIAVCGLTSLTMGKNSYWKGSKAMSPFLGGLPVSDSEFLRARLRNLLRVSVSCWGLVAAVGLVWFFKDANRELLEQAFGGLAYIVEARSALTLIAAYLLFTLYLAVVVPIPGLATGLCGRKVPDVAAGLAVGIAFMVALTWFAMQARETINVFSADEYRDPAKQLEYLSTYTAQIPTVLWWCLIAKLALLVVAIGMQARRGKINLKSLATNSIMLLLGCALLIGVFWALLNGTAISFQSVALVIAILFPCSSLLFASLGLDWNRHR